MLRWSTGKNQWSKFNDSVAVTNQDGCLINKHCDFVSRVSSFIIRFLRYFMTMKYSLTYRRKWIAFLLLQFLTATPALVKKWNYFFHLDYAVKRPRSWQWNVCHAQPLIHICVQVWSKAVVSSGVSSYIWFFAEKMKGRMAQVASKKPGNYHTHRLSLFGFNLNVVVRVGKKENSKRRRSFRASRRNSHAGFASEWVTTAAELRQFL